MRVRVLDLFSYGDDVLDAVKDFAPARIG